jgi:hypothetical protein
MWYQSTCNNGIATVPDTASSYFDSRGFHSVPFWNASLLWTTVPTWIFGIYGAFWSLMVEDLKDCQATIGLRQPQRHPGQLKSCLPLTEPKESRPGSSAKETILLDWGNPVLDWLHALGTKRFLLLMCILVNAVLFVVQGLSASVLSVAWVPVPNPVSLVADKVFDEYVGPGVGNVSSQPALDIISATLDYNGSTLPFTTLAQSFQPFRTQDDWPSGSITGITEAYSATLDCEFVSEESLLRSSEVFIHKDISGDGAQSTFTFNDRGCDVTVRLYTSSITNNYTRTWKEVDCSPGTGYYRFGLIAGQFDATAPFYLDNFTLITCKPSFWVGNVSITIASDGDNHGQVLEVKNWSPRLTLPFFTSHWLVDLPLYSNADPTIMSNMDDLGRVTYNYALKQNSDGAFDSSLLLSSFNTVFPAVYATFVSHSAFNSSEQPREFTGTLTMLQNRLFVDSRLALVIILLLVVAGCVTIWLMIYSHRNQGLLSKHLDLIIGHVILTRGSEDLMKYMKEIEDRVGQKNLKTVDLVKYVQADKQLSQWRCWYDEEKQVLRLSNEDAPSKAREQSEEREPSVHEPLQTQLSQPAETVDLRVSSPDRHNTV